MELTDRQLSILKAIIEEYAYTATPVSSKEIINKKYLQGVSSATIRNEMAFLETHGLLEKTHTSSGRIPSIDGYKFYQQFILTPKINGDLKTKLEQIFQNRDLSIDTIIDQSVQIINESFQLPLLVSKTEDENLKRFDLIQLAPNSALVIIVTSSGTVHKNQITIDNEKQFDDLAICIRVFNDRLVDTPISKINDKLDAIKDIIKVVVHEYEFCIRQVIERIFDMKVINKKIKVEGVKYLPTQPEFQNLERLKQILSFLEDTNVWKHIAYMQDQTGKTLITFGEQFGADKKNLAVASTSIDLGNNVKHQIAIVGPTRMEYDKVQGVLNFIKTELEKYKNN